MYLEHYNLTAKPFDLSPGPQFIWFGPKHEEALATLNYGIAANLGFLLLTGDVGVGKTALIHRLMSNLDASTIVAHITDPGVGTFDFFKLLAAEFNFASEFHSKGEFLIELEKFLHEAHKDGKKVLLVVDEAQRLNNKLLDQIRVLSNIEMSDRKLINIFFIGQPEFKEMLSTSTNRAIRQRIAINYHIDPLTESETRQYIDHRLHVAGATRDIFEPDALREIHQFTGGYPRAINIICDHALVTGYAFGLKSIDLDVIKECEDELNIRSDVEFRKADFYIPTEIKLSDTPKPILEEPEPTHSPMFGTSPIVWAMCILIGVFGIFYFLWPDPIDTETSISSIQPSESTENQSKSGAFDQMGSSETTDQTQPQDSEFPDKPLALADGETDNQVSTTPDDQTGSADRPTDSVTFESERTDADNEPAAESETESALSSEMAKELAALTAPPEIPPAVPPIQAAQADADPTSDSQTEQSTEPTPPSPQPSSDSNQAGAPAADEPQLEAETPPAPSRAKPAAPAEPAIQEEKQEIDRPVSSEEPSQQANAEDKTSPPTSDQPSDTSQPDSNVAAKTAAAAAAITAVKPPAQSQSGTLVSKAEPPSPPTSQRSAAAPPSAVTPPAPQTAQPEPMVSETPTEPTITAKAEAQLQPPAATLPDTQVSDKQPDSDNLEARLRLFLQDYCNIYAAKNLDAFSDLFVADARENGQPFIRLLPKYERNFSVIESIEYRIELEQFSYDGLDESVDMNGRFFLRWLPPDKKWRENSGTISMRLLENGTSFLVQRLDYRGGGNN